MELRLLIYDESYVNVYIRNDLYEVYDVPNMYMFNRISCVILNLLLNTYIHTLLYQNTQNYT